VNFILPNSLPSLSGAFSYGEQMQLADEPGAYRHCKEIFTPKRNDQRFCSQRCREAWAYDVRRAEIGVKKPRKRHLATPYREAWRMGIKAQ